MKLLYVEDHARFRAIVIAQFLSAHQVTVAGNLAEARKLLAVTTFDAVLLDFDLPDGKGIELLEEIQQRWPDLPVVAASSREENNDRLMAAGASATVGKLDFKNIGTVLERLEQPCSGGPAVGATEAQPLARAAQAEETQMETAQVSSPVGLGEALRRGREQHPDRPAVLLGEQRWSYGQLDEITDRIGTALLRLGVQPGDRVALLFRNVPEIVFSYYACFKIGAVAVPLNARLTGPELEYILDHSGARVLLGQHDLFSALWGTCPRPEAVEHVYLVGDDSLPSGTRCFAELLQPPAAATPFPDVEEHTPAAILYTSGTTARPKGVTHTHHTLDRTIDCYVAHTGLASEDVVGVFLPMGHIFGFALMLLPALRSGASALLIPQFEPETVLRSLQQHRVSMVGALPVMYNALVNCPAAASCELPSLKYCLAGGDALPTELQRRFHAIFGVELTEGCGMTEVIPYSLNPAYTAKRAGSIGWPAPGVRLRVVDDGGRDVVTGEVGEVLVQSEACMIGYWNDPAATAAALQDGWLRTGDLGRQEEDGATWFVGRQKEIIIRGGSNISPLEVEEALYQHPAVREAGVIGVPDPTWGEVVHAYVALQEGAAASEAELKQFLQARLAAYKVPEVITFLPDLPKGATGKIHRKTLRERATGQPG